MSNYIYFKSAQEMIDALKAGISIDYGDTDAELQEDGSVKTTFIPYDGMPLYDDYDSIEEFMEFVGG